MDTKDNCPCVESKSDLEAMLQANDRIMVLFYASWCPFCARFLPIFQKHATGEQTFIAVQDDEESIAGAYDVEVFPTVLFFEKGTVSRRLEGVAGAGLGEKQFEDFVRTCP